jgi:hypothetical protein
MSPSTSHFQGVVRVAQLNQSPHSLNLTFCRSPHSCSASGFHHGDRGTICGQGSPGLKLEARGEGKYVCNRDERPSSSSRST